MSKWSEARKKIKKEFKELPQTPLGRAQIATARDKRIREIKGGAEARKDEISETEDLKRREQELAREIKNMTDIAIRYMRRDFSILIKGEEKAIEVYEWAVKAYSRFGWTDIFSDILKDEREHLEKLHICLRSIEEVYQREGHIKST